jgi:hypothetical protein
MQPHSWYGELAVGSSFIKIDCLSFRCEHSIQYGPDYILNFRRLI